MKDSVDLVLLMLGLFKVDSRHGYSILHLACIHNSPRTLRHLLSSDEYRAFIDSRDRTPEQMTPLMIAVRHGCDLASILLEHGASVEPRTADRSRSVLHLAAFAAALAYLIPSPIFHTSHDLPRLLRLLIGAGCSPADVDTQGHTAVSLLCQSVLHGRVQHRTSAVESLQCLLDADVHRPPSTAEAIIAVSTGIGRLHLRMLHSSSLDQTNAAVGELIVLCELLTLLVSRSLDRLDSVDNWNPERLARNIVSTLCILCNNVTATANRLESPIGQAITGASDIVRMLLLSSDFTAFSTDDLNAMFITPFLSGTAAAAAVDLNNRLHHLVRMLLAVLPHHTYYSVLLKVHRNTLVDCSPRTLKDLSRFAVLSACSPRKRMLSIKQLVLPSYFYKYLLLETEV